VADSGSGTTFRIQRCLGRLARGDLAARNELFAHSQSRLVALAQFMRRDFGRLARLEDTDDVLQQAAIRLCRALESMQPASPADFFRLAALQIRRELVDLTRRHYGRNGASRELAKTVDLGTDSDGLATQLPDPESGPAEMAEWTEFHKAVDHLPEPERLAFELVWYHGLSQAEAAAVMDISERHWRRHWLSARLRLSDLLPGFFESPDSVGKNCPQSAPESAGI
jgi:RNA polymerase sigma-70 factor (ECF subfamily)